jgi:predicted aminopeptidase
MIRALRSLLPLLPLLLLAGCANFSYYTQAIGGQMDILAKSRPIDEWIDDPATKPETRQKLATVLTLREFATRELGLPDNRSYRSYADLERPFAMWNVFATPELSLQPREWCFVVAGCVSYRGYFAQAEADRFAAELKQQGDDVYVGGVAAYSTLGWFNDPMLNTVLRRSETEIAGILFHELAHQKLYVKNDSAFNESFATVVELEGVKRWLLQQGKPEEFQRYQKNIKRREEFVAFVLRHRERLAKIYAANLSDNEKRVAKAHILEELRSNYAALKTRWGGYEGYDSWFTQDLNNARLVSIGLYHQHVAAFQKLLARRGSDLTVFYHAVEEMVRQPKEKRDSALSALGAS